MAKKTNKPKTWKEYLQKTDKTHTRLARELDNKRRQYTRKIKRLEKEIQAAQAKGTLDNDTLYRASQAIGLLEKERSQLTVKNTLSSIPDNIPQKDKFERLNTIFGKTEERLSTLNTKKNTREIVAQVRKQYSSNIMQFAYFEGIWEGGRGQTSEAVWEKLKEAAAYGYDTDDGEHIEGLGMEVEDVTDADMIEYYEELIKERFQAELVNIESILSNPSMADVLYATMSHSYGKPITNEHPKANKIRSEIFADIEKMYKQFELEMPNVK